jgi:2,3-bisphosphoglycerate-dependent phosphoglycerate mutase
MQFYFIRHGQSANNELYARVDSHRGRHQDPELTARGRRQAECLARFLSQPRSVTVNDARDRQNAAGFGLTHIYTSLMVRAVHTATIVGEAVSLPIVAWEDVHEEWGIYLADEATGERVGLPGKDRSYFQAHYPDLVLPGTLGDAGWWSRPAEPVEERIPRARRVYRTLLERHGGTEDRVAVISHGGFYQCLMTVLLDIPLEDG